MTGDYAWGLRTRGDLRWIDKMLLLWQVVMERSMHRRKKARITTYLPEDVTLPDSGLVKNTLQFLHDTHRTFLVNHCVRTYLFAHAIGKNESLRFDPEVLTVASLLHDVGLTDLPTTKKKECRCFAVAGAAFVGEFLEHESVDIHKTKIIQDAIALHLNIRVPSKLPEAYLLNKGASVDVIGRYLNRFDQQFVHQVLYQYPRLQFKVEIQKLMSEQCARSPHSRIAFLCRNRFLELIRKARFDE